MRRNVLKDKMRRRHDPYKSIYYHIILYKGSHCGTMTSCNFLCDNRHHIFASYARAITCDWLKTVIFYPPPAPCDMPLSHKNRQLSLRHRHFLSNVMLFGRHTRAPPPPQPNEGCKVCVICGPRSFRRLFTDSLLGVVRGGRNGAYGLPCLQSG